MYAAKPRTVSPLMRELTERQEEVLVAIRAHLRRHRVPPSRAELATALGVKSLSTVKEHLMHLALKGWIELPEGRTQRGIRLLDEDLPVIEVLGEIAAGEPIVAEVRTVESMPSVVADRFHPRPSYFLTVRDDSMDRTGLHEGDLVAVRADANACEGKIVVARFDNLVTLQRLVRLNAHEVELRPESHNRSHRVKRIDLQRTALDIDGFVVGALLGRMFEYEGCEQEARS